VVLSIHDSFVVQTRHAPVRDEIMENELQKLLAKLSGTTKSAVPAMAWAQSVPHNGDRPAAPPPLLILVSERAFAFGGLAPFAVSASVLEGWGGGVAPEPVRTALRHEIEARGLTQERLAREVGLSRPQLTNLLVGRFGTSPEVASRLKAFLLAA
jgi:AraC-like DNA-binding protein